MECNTTETSQVVVAPPLQANTTEVPKITTEQLKEQLTKLAWDASLTTLGAVGKDLGITMTE